MSSGGGDSIRLVEHQPGHVICIIHSGYLAPSVTIRLGQRDVTDQFMRTINVTMTGSRGLRLIDYVTVLESVTLYARATDDGQRLVCQARVTGLPAVSVQSKITVNCKSSSPPPLPPSPSSSPNHSPYNSSSHFLHFCSFSS